MSFTGLDLVLASCLGAALLLVTLLLARRPFRRSVEAEALRAVAELRVVLEARMGELGQGNAEAVSALGDTLSRRLHSTVEDNMRASFTRVTEQFASVQTALGDMQATAKRLADLRRLFGNVRARGAWGERQLKALLDDFLPEGAYEANRRLRPDASGENVEFAVRMPAADGAMRLLAIDAKFPTESYERLLAADEEGDADAARAARRGLEAAIRAEAKRIGSKYVLPPVTPDFAVLYLPTDGLYVEASRLPGLLDEVGRMHRVLVMGPAILPGLLRSIGLGHAGLRIGAEADTVRRLLDETRAEMRRLDATLDRVARGTEQTLSAIAEARRRTRLIGRRLDGPSDRSGEADPEIEAASS